MRRKNKPLLLLIGVSVAATMLALAPRLTRAADTVISHALFKTSDQCMACHGNVHAASGQDVSIGFQWRATMMANSARDPYWHAAVRRETLDHPAAAGLIEDTCSTCHMPMARFQAHAEGRQGEVLRYLAAAGAGGAAPDATAVVAPDAAAMALDGVSCTVCHQMRDDNFGQESSFDGGFVIDVSKPPETREIYGRFEVDRGRTRLMNSATGFLPTQATHLQKSELCATCHTLFTRALDDRGNIAGVLPEQVPYHEWLHSDFAETDSCQSCHMPRLSEDAHITSVLGQPRPNVSQHVFVGGNAFMLRILKDFGQELNVSATPEELEASAALTEAHLATATAAVEISQPQLTGQRLGFQVTLRNKAGHKLPTAYPARRVWLHVTVRDASGGTVFESGASQPDGSIAGNDNDSDGAAFEPHYERITNADQVQIYESIMGDYAGRVTTGLLYGARYLKDNRLLPRGFQKADAPEDVAVRGAALTDGDFQGGADAVAYDIAVGGAAGPFAVTVEALYQAIGFRWANNLRNYDTAESQRFLRYFSAHAAASSKLLARQSVQTQ
jgi:hypothetical protein